MIHDMNKKLVGIRFTSVGAEIGPGIDTKQAGSLVSDVKMGVSDIVDGQNTATVSINVKGIPQGETEDNFAFSISITGVALWNWSGDIPTPELLRQEATIYELCYAAHTVIVAEVTRLALGLGFPGVSPSWNPGPESDFEPPSKPRTSASRTRKPKGSTAKE